MIRSMVERSVIQGKVFSGDHFHNSKLRDVVVDLVSACILINDDQNCFFLEPFAYQEILISVCYRLLHRYPLASNGPSNKNEKAIYLGVLAWMTTVLFQHGRSLRLSYDILQRNIRDFIDGISGSDIIDPTIFLWLLFLSGLTTSDVNNRDWLLPPIKKCLFTLNIDSWPSVHESIGKLPWLNIFHNKRGQELWQALIWK
jgi:hypothetical protein